MYWLRSATVLFSALFLFNSTTIGPLLAKPLENYQSSRPLLLCQNLPVDPNSTQNSNQDGSYPYPAPPYNNSYAQPDPQMSGQNNYSQGQYQGQNYAQGNYPQAQPVYPSTAPANQGQYGATASPQDAFSSNPPAYPQSGNANDPTFYGYANDLQQQQQQGQSQQYNQQPAQSLNATANTYFNQADQAAQTQAAQPETQSKGPSMLKQVGKALAGAAVPLATGYFLTKAANRQARLNGYPPGYGGYGGYGYPPGYGNPYMGGMGGMGNMYGNPYGNQMGGFGNPMGGGMLNMFGQ